MRTKGAKNKVKFVNIKLSVLNSVLKENADIAVSKEFADSISKLVGNAVATTEIINFDIDLPESKKEEIKEEKIAFTQIY